MKGQLIVCAEILFILVPGFTSYCISSYPIFPVVYVALSAITTYYLTNNSHLKYRFNNWYSKPGKIATRKTSTTTFVNIPKDIIVEILYKYASNGPQETIDVWSTCAYIHNDVRIKQLYDIRRGWYRARYVVSRTNLSSGFFDCDIHDQLYHFGTETIPGIIQGGYNGFDSESFPGLLCVNDEIINMCDNKLYILPYGIHDVDSIFNYIRVDYNASSCCTMILWSTCRKNVLQRIVEFI